MKNLKNRRGYTLIELLISIISLLVMLVVAVMILLLPSANFWITEDGVLKAAKVANPASAEILQFERNAISLSKIVVRNSDGTQSTYEVNSNILFNYTLRKVAP